MMRLKWFLKLFTGLVIFAAFTWWSARSLWQAPAPVPGLVNSNSPANSPANSLESETKTTVSKMDRVRGFYQTESQRVGAVDKDPILTEKRLREFAATLQEEEIRWLISEAADSTNNGDGRFFAVYLLALADNAFAFRALSELAVTSVPESKNNGLVELERQLRAQAIEGLARACQKNKDWKDSLLDIVSRQSDEFLRDRAHRGLYQCETGKSLEEQDKEALQKLRKAPKNK